MHVKVVVTAIDKILLCYVYRQQKTLKQPEPSVSHRTKVKG